MTKTNKKRIERRGHTRTEQQRANGKGEEQAQRKKERHGQNIESAASKQKASEKRKTPRCEEILAIGLYVGLRQTPSFINLSPLFSKLNFCLVK